MSATSHTDLLPAEKLALTVSLARLRRGEEPLPNTATVCIFALARITGLYDWTTDKASAAEAAALNEDAEVLGDLAEALPDETDLSGEGK